MHAFTYACMCVYMDIYLCMHLCVYIRVRDYIAHLLTTHNRAIKCSEVVRLNISRECLLSCFMMMIKMTMMLYMMMLLLSMTLCRCYINYEWLPNAITTIWSVRALSTGVV